MATASPTPMAMSGSWCTWTRTRRRRTAEGASRMHSATHQAIAAVWRIESAKIVAVVARMVRDVGVAEELAQDTLVTALERWPTDGVPNNPGAWLMTAAKNRALDHLRRAKVLDAKLEEIGHDLEAQEA